ncbi:hypothetical protein RHSIM_Rhsim09G0076500 [Rhododendron simsii]|uniref:Uncharacterized protein n=1 Tax=Rhododendron simsii TaxID=118357 RepID=A0A834GKV5_RHOSS|nr:hypothetical protein RHSIM_Rhsim09G0076500 [Rhododendron simsii]
MAPSKLVRAANRRTPALPFDLHSATPIPPVSRHSPKQIYLDLCTCSNDGKKAWVYIRAHVLKLLHLFPMFKKVTIGMIDQSVDAIECFKNGLVPNMQSNAEISEQQIGISSLGYSSNPSFFLIQAFKAIASEPNMLNLVTATHDLKILLGRVNWAVRVVSCLYISCFHKFWDPGGLDSWYKIVLKLLVAKNKEQIFGQQRSEMHLIFSLLGFLIFSYWRHHIAKLKQALYWCHEREVEAIGGIILFLFVCSQICSYHNSILRESEILWHLYTTSSMGGFSIDLVVLQQENLYTATFKFTLLVQFSA